MLVEVSDWLLSGSSNGDVGCDLVVFGGSKYGDSVDALFGLYIGGGRVGSCGLVDMC